MRSSRRAALPITSAGNFLQIAADVANIAGMKLRFIVIGLAIMVALIRVGLHSSNSSRSGGGSSNTSAADEQSMDPATIAKKVDQFAAEELKEKKLDAKQWLAANNHGTFEVKKEDVVRLTNDCLAAGAVGVWCS